MSATPPLENPFKGLQPFEQADENKLFGRERDLILFKERILSSRTTLLFAGSGVGKTSFLNAKVIPELAKRYCVIWHNRWTGAGEETENWDDHPSFKIWPPQDLGKWLIEILFGAWRRRRLALSKATPKKKAEAVQQKLAVDVQEVITQSLKPGNEKRLSEVLSVFRKEAKGELADDIRKKGCMLILDQFEEVFQYHVYEDYFETFIADLCKIINDDEYQVRVVFSMREEFLGELTAFDNRIPDLFNNYYRLRYPKTDEARRIITETCRLSNVEPHPGNLVKLVDDLSSIEKNFTQNNTGDKSEVRTVRFVRRDYVPPPYLQIVCDSLWKEEYEKPATNGGTSIQIKRFLEDYKSAPETPADGVESDAQRAVRQFCEAKLSLPFLRKWEQNIAARAFGFLVTKQGAKMAYELRSLAAHMEERAWALKHVLEKLSQPEARILRESRGPEGSYWFELYHDMYAGVVDRWKKTYLKAQRKRQRLQLVGVAGSIALLILSILMIQRIRQAREYQGIITNYATNLRNPDLNDDQYNAALIAYSNLKDTLGYKSTAHSLWAKVWQRRAQLFAMKEKPEEALICFLQAAALTTDETLKKDYIGQANNLLLGNEEAIQHTFCTDCRVGAVSRDARYFVTITQDRIYNISNFSGRPFQATLCSDCTGRPVFSADGNSVAVIRQVPEAEKKTDNNKSRAGEGSAGLGGATGGAPGTSSGGSSTTNTKDFTGWEVKISPSEPSFSSAAVITFVIKKPAVAPATPQNTERVDPNSTRPREVEFSLKAVSKIDNGFLVAGVLDQRLAIWKQDGKEFFEVGFLKSNRGSVSARFSADGKFFATSGADIEPRVFEVTKTGLSPVTEVAKSRVSLFSPSSKYLLARNTDSLTIWDLGNRKEIKTLAMPLSATQLVFALDSDLFVIVYNHSAVTVRSCATGEPVFEELKINDISPPVILGREAKSLVLSTSEYSDTYEKYSLETAQKTGELDLGGRSLGTVAGDGDSLLISEDDLVRLWQIPPIKPSENVARVAEDGQRIEALNQNGSIMLLSDNDEWSGAAGKFQVKDITQNKEFFSFSEKSSLYKLSPDGNWVAARTNDNEVKLFSAAESQNPPKLSFNNRVSQITYSSDGRFLAVWTEDAQPHIFDTKSGVTSNLETADFDPVSLSFTPNSQYLVASMRGPSVVDKSVVTPAVEPGKPTLAIWSIASGKKILPTLNDKERVDAVAISNNRIAISQTKKIHLFDITTGNEIREFAYPGDLALLSLREDGKLMGTCDRDGVLQLWDADEGKAGSTISLGSAAYQMFFAADGASLVAVTTDNWAHQIDIGHTLHYASGIFTGEIDSYSIRPLGGNTITGLKFISAEVRHPHVYVKDFHSSDGVLDTKSNAQELLDKWRAKLNYYVRPDGFLANGSPGTTVSY